MNQNPKVDWFPTPGWSTALREGDQIWLVKENTTAYIAYDYSFNSGRVCLRRDGWQHNEIWFVNVEGNGIDGKPLIRPIKGKCSSEPVTISESKLNELERQIEKQEAYILSLDRRVSTLLSGTMYNEFQEFLRLKESGELVILKDEDDEAGI